jgi:hypothetical protein
MREEPRFLESAGYGVPVNRDTCTVQLTFDPPGKIQSGSAPRRRGLGPGNVRSDRIPQLSRDFIAVSADARTDPCLEP